VATCAAVLAEPVSVTALPSIEKLPPNVPGVTAVVKVTVCFSATAAVEVTLPLVMAVAPYPAA